MQICNELTKEATKVINFSRPIYGSKFSFWFPPMMPIASSRRALTCYSTYRHGLFLRWRHGHHHMVHVWYLFTVWQIHRLPFSLRNIFHTQPRLFVLNCVAGVKKQWVHDGTGHKLNNPWVVRSWAAGFRLCFNWTVIGFSWGHR